MLASNMCSDRSRRWAASCCASIAEALDIGRIQVARWRKRLASERLAGIERDLPRGTSRCGAAGGADYAVSSKLSTFTYQGAPILISDRRSGGLFCSPTFSCKDGEFAAMLRKEQLASPHPSKPVASPGLMAHRKIGHAGYKTLQRIAGGNLVEGLDITPEQVKTAMEDPCLSCQVSKARRLPAPPSDTRASAPLELVHTDVIGPMPVSSLNNERYVVTLLDDYSRASQVRLLSSKADVPEALQTMINVFETQIGSKVRRVRSDRGTEFNNATLHSYYDNRGIVPEYAPPYTPTSHARAERLNLTLLNLTRAVLADSRLPTDVWGEVLKC
jgi:transposase InsO family protein